MWGGGGKDAQQAPPLFVTNSQLVCFEYFSQLAVEFFFFFSSFLSSLLFCFSFHLFHRFM